MKNKLHIFFFLILFSYSNLRSQTNINFESTSIGTYTSANAVNGWTVSSQTATACNSSTVWTPGSPEFSIVSTPVLSFPFIGTISNSPLGGYKVARLNNSTANASRTKIAYTFSVNYGFPLLELAFAGVWEGATSHQCCEKSGFQIQLKDQAGNALSCTNYSFAPGTGCGMSSSTFSYSSTSAWTDWQIKYIGLSPYTGSVITLEVISNDCAYNDHYGTLFFDARTMVGDIYCTNCPSLPNSVFYCAGSGIAQLNAHLGYAGYQWIAPGSGSVAAPQGTLPILTVTNAIANSVYSVMLQTYSGCTFISTLSIVPSSVSIVGIGSSSSCAGGTSGSATIAASGSGGGYSYAWYNSTNSLVATTSVVSNLPPGTYSVSVGAAGSQSTSCGVSSSSITIGVSPSNWISRLNPFCSNEAYLYVPGGNTGGTNYQWYNGLTAISASLGGTSSSYTVTAPTQGSVYHLSYLSSQGCHDSIKYTLVSVPPGSLNISPTPVICPGANNGTVQINLFPASGSPPGTNYFYVNSLGTTPPFSASVNAAPFNTFSVANLFAGGTYSVDAFDGSCKYSATFSITPLVFNYSLSVGSVTLCSGNGIAASVNFDIPPPPTQYLYTWSPSQFLFGGNASSAIITPSISQGTTAVLIYSVTVTPTITNCPLTKTLSITVANPLTPTISPVPQLCSNGSAYSIAVNPGGGTFINGSGSAVGNVSGVLTPSLSSIGVNTFTYSNSIGTCVAQSSASYVVNPPPNISIAGNTLICEGESLTLLASGANSYTWSNTSINPFITISPSVTSSYTVKGEDVLTTCSNSKTIVISVESYPVLSVLGDTLLCAGETATLMAYGASTYSWSNGFSSPSITVSPNITSTYSLSGTSALASCSSTQAVTVTIEVCDLTNIIERSATENGIVYPNPSNGKFFIDATTILSFIVVDGLGKIILEGHFQKKDYEFDLSGYPNGIYTLKVFQNNEIKTLKLIKTD